MVTQTCQPQCFMLESYRSFIRKVIQMTDNWRHISLMNTDYKIFAKILMRLNDALAKVIETNLMKPSKTYWNTFTWKVLQRHKNDKVSAPQISIFPPGHSCRQYFISQCIKNCQRKPWCSNNGKIFTCFSLQLLVAPSDYSGINQ